MRLSTFLCSFDGIEGRVETAVFGSERARGFDSIRHTASQY